MTTALRCATLYCKSKSLPATRVTESKRDLREKIIAKLKESKDPLVAGFDAAWAKPGLDPARGYIKNLSDNDLGKLIPLLSDARVAMVITWLSDARVARVAKILGIKS